MFGFNRDEDTTFSVSGISTELFFEFSVDVVDEFESDLIVYFILFKSLKLASCSFVGS